MKKKLLVSLVLLCFLTPCTGAFAKYSSSGNNVKIAIKKYRSGNYTGCLQDCQSIVKRNPSNATAYYYMAMSYVMAGKKDEAIKAYSKVLSLRPNALLTQYATTGKRCLETPDQCNPVTAGATATDTSELDKFINSNSSDGLSSNVRKDFHQKYLNDVKNKINSGKELDDYSFRKLNHLPENNEVKNESIKLASVKPTDEQVQDALKVLQSAGYNPYMNSQVNSNPMMMQNPELMQINAMMGGSNQSSGNDAMMNMLPYIMSQNKDGASSYAPQMMQAVIMNSMMTNFNYDVDTNK